MNMMVFKGADIITETQVLKGYVLGVGDKFTLLEPEERFDAEDAQVIDAKGLMIAPGLIDVHIHGSGGRDTMEGTLDALSTISGTIVKNGVTLFLATTMTMEREMVEASLTQIREAVKRRMPGAQLFGAHMEGPFISPKFKGAQAAENIRLPSWEWIEPFKDVIKIVTLAPEQPGAKELASRLKEHNIIASMGHTAATYDEAMEGIKAGISHTTHLFNAMSGVHHRNPGTVVAALASDVYCELIADTIHVHPGLFEMVRKAKGADRITLITDCMEAGGMPDGNYTLGGQPVIVNGNEARLTDGTLAGSVLRLNRALYNFYKNTDCELHEVFNMASVNPARELGIDDRKGSIKVGKDADFVLMDQEFNVKATYIRGVCMYK
jgi:N-acetylglucosamine-6-phosphate deacetylase